MRILIVEDEPSLNKIIGKMLKQDGHITDSCFDGEEALDYITSVEYDVILLDVMLPHKSGIDVLKEIRSKSITTPVILLTAMDGINDRVAGLDAGADDYITKPFSFDELFARIRAVTRRPSGAVTNVYTVSDLVIDTDKRTVIRGGKSINLSSKEYAVLLYMVRNKGIVLSRDKLENGAWGIDFEGDSNVVDVYIRFLRKKLDDGFETKLIHTVRGAGYVLRATEDIRTTP